jgi:CheY-like chemotaxis protein
VYVVYIKQQLLHISHIFILGLFCSMGKDNFIVVADDDPAILDAMKMILEFYNFTVETVADGLLLPQLLRHKPQLLFLDVCMAGVNGGEICKALKKNVETKDIPVVMISANTDLVKTVKQSGADDYLAKPFQIEDLISKVDKYLAN